MIPKKESILFLILCVTSHFLHAEGTEYYEYQCVYDSTPEIFRGYFFDLHPGGKIFYGGIDRHGRYLIKKVPPSGPSLFYAFYTDEHGELWQILIDREEKKEIPLVKVKDPNSIDDYDVLLPEQVKENCFIPKENITYPPKNIPKLTDPDFEMIEIQFDVNHEESTQILPNKQRRANSSPARFQPAYSNETSQSSNHNDAHDDYENSKADPSSFLGIGKASWLPSLFWTTTALTFACTYYYLFTNLTEYNRFLVREDTWSTWKRNKESYETLLQIEPKRLAHLLIEDINTVYYQEPNPVKLFLEDIAQEYEKLSHAIQVRNIAINLWLPVHDIFYTLEDRLCLLNHLRSAVHAWRAKQY